MRNKKRNFALSKSQSMYKIDLKSIIAAGLLLSSLPITAQTDSLSTSEKGIMKAFEKIISSAVVPAPETESK